MPARLDDRPPGRTADGRTPAYGYLRRPSGPADLSAAVLAERLRRFADGHGMQLVGTFQDSPTGTCDGLQAVVDELRAFGVTVLLVPSVRHLAASPLLQNVYIERLETSAGVIVVSLHDAERC